MTNDGNLALRMALARNRAERRNAARMARRTAAATARRLAVARRLFGSTRVSDVEKAEALEPTHRAPIDPRAALLDLIAPEPEPSNLATAETQRDPDSPPPPRLDDVRRGFAAPRPGPVAGTALAAA